MIRSVMGMLCRNEDLGVRSRAVLLATFPKQKRAIEAITDRAQVSGASRAVRSAASGLGGGITSHSDPGADPGSVTRASPSSAGGFGVGDGAEMVLQLSAAWGGGAIRGPSDEAASVAEELAMNMTPVGQSLMCATTQPAGCVVLDSSCPSWSCGGPHGLSPPFEPLKKGSFL